MSHYPLIRSLSIVNINGIMARTLSLVNPHSLRPSRQYGGTVSLLGNNGAGKTSLLGAFMFSQIPDIRYISLGTRDDFKVSQSIKDSEMFPRLGQPCLVALEVEARGTGHRHLYIVRAEKTTGTTLSTQLYCLKLPDNIKPLDCLLDRDGLRGQPVTPDSLRDKAAMLGCDIRAFKDSNAYMLALFQDGILPRSCQTPDDKYKLAQILHSAMAGRLDKSIERHLSAYLMAHTRGNVSSVVNMVHESMMKVRHTQRDLENYKKDYQFFNSLLELSLQFSANAWVIIELQLAMVDEERVAVYKNKNCIESEIDKIKERLKSLKQKLRKIKDEQAETQQQIENIKPQRLSAQEGKIHYDNKQKAIKDLSTLEPLLAIAKEAYIQQQDKVKELERKRNDNENSQRIITQQLAHAGTRYLHSQKMAAQYEHASQLYQDISHWHPDLDLSKLDALIEQLKQQELEYGEALSRSKHQLQHHENIVTAYITASEKAQKIGENISPLDARSWFIEKQAMLKVWNTEAGKLDFLQQNKQRLQRDRQKQRHLQQYLNDAGIFPLPENLDNFEQLLTVQQENEYNFNEQKEQLEQRRCEVQAQINNLDIVIERYVQQSQQWHRLQPSVDYLRNILPDTDFTTQYCNKLTLEYSSQINLIRQTIITHEAKITQNREQRNKLSEIETGSLDYLRTLAAEVSGIPVVELYADVSVQDAEYFEAALGPLMHAILINGAIDDAVRLLLSHYGEQWPLPDVLLISITQPIESLRTGQFESNLLFKDITDEYITIEDNAAPWCVIDEQPHRRISQLRANPVLGEKAREALIVQLSQQIQQVEAHIEELEIEVNKLERNNQHLRLVIEAPAFIWGEEPPLEDTRLQRITRQNALNELDHEYQRISRQWEKSQIILHALQYCESDSEILFQDFTHELNKINYQIEQSEQAKRSVQRHQSLLQQIEKNLPLLRENYPEDIAKLQLQVECNEKEHHNCFIRGRQVKNLDQVRAHLNPEYASAKELLENEEKEQTILLTHQKRLEQEREVIKSEF
ncbi:chromosome partition protein MukB [Photorhabdus bodei]|uniref:chromosome partition protein MukB n=1 Tax=Photorhabdus bodei TaxID=2029681 RepID=UPI0032B8645A